MFDNGVMSAFRLEGMQMLDEGALWLRYRAQKEA